jgi:hypothetical protein
MGSCSTTTATAHQGVWADPAVLAALQVFVSRVTVLALLMDLCEEFSTRSVLTQ